jgi:hypothetical protein
VRDLVGRAAPWVAGFLVGGLLVVVAVPEMDEEIAEAGGRGRTAGPTVRGSAASGLGAGEPLEDGGQDAPAAIGAQDQASLVDAGPAGSQTAGGAPTSGGDDGVGAAATPGRPIRLGVGLPDIGAVAALGPGYDQGDPHAHVESILAQLRAEGRLPIHGRDIEPVYRTYNILSAESQRSACEGFAQDDDVFAVVAISNFDVGYECVTEEYGIPLLTSNGVTDELYASTPNMISLQMSLERHLRNFVEWADRRGFLDGRRIGVYYGTDPTEARMARQNVLGPLMDRGHTVAAEVQTSESTTGGPTDSVAVQRFRANQVEVAILLVSPIAKTNFMTQANTQGYRPTYLENDLASSTTTTATSTYPAQHFDGSRGFTGLRFGEAAAGLAEPAPARWCREAVGRHSGRVLDREAREAEFIASNRACDAFTILLDGLASAGPDLSANRFLGALSGLERREMGIHGDIGYQPGRQHGTETWRELVWRAGCTCWVAEGRFQPLWLP